MRLILVAAVMMSALPLPAEAITFDQLIDRIQKRQEQVKADVADLTIRQIVRIRAEGVESSQKIVAYRKGAKTRTEMVMTMPLPSGEERTMQSIVVDDGAEKWSYNSMTGAQRIDTGRDAPGPADADDWWEGVRGKGEVLGEETVSGRKTWHVRYDERGTPVDTWIDRKDYFPVKMERTENGLLTRQVAETFLDTGAGFDWPARTVIFRDNVAVGSVVVESFDTDTGLSDALFDTAELKKRERGGFGDMMKKAMDRMRRGGE
jgi:hypothetical protein